MSKKTTIDNQHELPHAKKQRISEQTMKVIIISLRYIIDQEMESTQESTSDLKTENEKLKEQITELKKRESTLVMRLSIKESELNELQVSQISYYII